MEKVLKARENLLATEKTGKLIIKFAIPAVLSMLVDAIYNIADQIFIGHGVGYIGIAATTVAVPLVTIVLAISTMLGIGGSVFTSMRMGENKSGDAEKMLGTVFTLSAAIGIVLSVTCFVFIEPIVYLLGATDVSLPYVLDYMRIIVIGIPFSILAVTMSSMVRAVGNPIFVMIVFVIGSVIDLVSNPIYIFVLGWGVKGAAISTVTSQILTSLVFTLYFCKKGTIRLRLENILPSASMFGQMLMFGIPACVIQIGEAVSQIVLNNALIKQGVGNVGSAVALSTVGIVLRVGSIIISICVGIAIGIQPVLGFNKGAGLVKRVKEIYKRAVLLGTAVSVIGWLCCELFPAQILGIFGMNEPEYVSFGIKSMRISLSGFFTVGFQIITANYFLAVGKPLQSLILSILRPVLLTLPFVWVFSQIWGLDGILYAVAAACLIAPIITAVFITWDFRRNNSSNIPTLAKE